MNKAKGPGTTLSNADMTEILTPDVVAADDFVTKEHLTTVLVIVPRGGEKEFLDSYERVDPFVVPRSAKKFSKFVNGALEPIQDKVWCCRSIHCTIRPRSCVGEPSSRLVLVHPRIYNQVDNLKQLLLKMKMKEKILSHRTATLCGA